MPTMYTVTVIIVCAVVIDLCAILVVTWLKRDFQWLITGADECPQIDSGSLQRFLKHGYDPVLGWERKAGTMKREEVKSVGEQRRHFIETSYAINEHKARLNPGHENLPVVITTYGDSFAFARHVNDDQTWQWHLSRKTGTNVVNLGVGNYGLDQALVRLKREYPRQNSRIVIMMVVPETISRIVNVWKHYSEYGNTLGFKGRFFKTDGALQWLDTPIDRPEEYQNISAHLDRIREIDICYQKKFRNDIIRFPYSLSLLRNCSRHFPLVGALVVRKLYALCGCYDEHVLNRPWKLVLKRNFAFTHELYKQNEPAELLCDVIDAFSEFVCDNGSTPVLVFAPYRQDVDFIVKQYHFYQHVVEHSARKMITVDLSDAIRQHTTLDELYVSRFYGAHFSDYGNRFAAESLYSELVNKGVLDKDSSTGAS